MRKLVAFLLPLVLCASPAMAGSVFISGHDAEDHGAEAIYAGLYDNILNNVTNGGSGILSIGANGGMPAANWIMDVASQMTFPQAVTLVNGFAISSVDFSTFAILHIPSDRGDVIGGILPAENALLTARAADVEAFVNGGGGLFALTQGELPDAYGWLGPIGTITTMPVGILGDLPSGNKFDDVTATVEGLALGITDTNLDGCCWHNVFTAWPTFLTVLATANTPHPADVAFHNQAAALGGEQVIVQLSCIDIKPGSDINSINRRNRGVVPVAALGSTTFDVGEIDPSSVRFGADSASPAHKVEIHFSDVNADGITDAVFHFITRETGIQHGDVEACMTWTTYAGVDMMCCDSVRTVPTQGHPGGGCSGAIGGPMPFTDIFGTLLPYLLLGLVLLGLRFQRRPVPRVAGAR